MPDPAEQGPVPELDPTQPASATSEPHAEEELREGLEESFPEPTTNGSGEAPPSFLEGLRADYQRAVEGADSTTTLPIVPGRFHGNLAARYHRIDWDKRRKRIAKLQREGGAQGADAELVAAAQVIVDACDCILVRPSDGAELVPLHEHVPEFRGEPVRFDARLMQALKIEDPGSAISRCRALFLNPGALMAHFYQVELWLNEAVGDDGEEYEERPT